ncbi:MAG: MFS transporter, partial [Betaproteobacteria bacterium]|nr:MFS transporter [Betaproteobacteria bacterium]
MLPYWRLSSFYLFYFAFIGVMAPYWPLFLQSRGFGAFEIGVLMSLLHVMRIFAPNLWGHLADRSGRRMIWVQMGILATLLGFCLVFWLQDFWGMFLMMALVSFFWSGALPLVEANTLTHLGERSERYGRIRLWGSIGFILMVIGVGDLLDHQSVSVLPWIILALLAGTVLAARFMPEAVVQHSDAEGVPLGQLLRRPKVLALFAAAILMAAA